MILCCNKKIKKIYSFYSESNDPAGVKKIEFGRCPHCGKSVYAEVRKKLNCSDVILVRKGTEAEKLLNTALFNRLFFLDSVKQGSKTRQFWYFGSFKKSAKKDSNGNFIEIQLKKNFNNEIVEVLGEAPIAYYGKC